MEKLIERIKYQISCFKSEKSKVGASQIDKLSLGGRIAALEELLADISTDDRPLTPEILAAAGWKSNINRRYPYKQQFRKEGERFNEYCADVAFVIFEENKVSFYKLPLNEFDNGCHIENDWVVEFDKKVVGNVFDNPELLKKEEK